MTEQNLDISKTPIYAHVNRLINDSGLVVHGNIVRSDFDQNFCIVVKGTRSQIDFFDQTLLGVNYSKGGLFNSGPFKTGFLCDEVSLLCAYVFEMPHEGVVDP